MFPSDINQMADDPFNRFIGHFNLKSSLFIILLLAFRDIVYDHRITIRKNIKFLVVRPNDK